MGKLQSTLVVVLLASAFLFDMGGCKSTGDGILYHPINLKEPGVLVKPFRPCIDRPRLAILSFWAPPYAAGAADVLTSAYTQELVRSGLFRQVAVVRQVSPEDMSVLDVSNVAAKDYDLVLRGKISYLLAGTGSSPIELAVEVQLVDVSPQMLRWYVKQQASSKPSADIDLIWSTIPGNPSVPYQVLAEAVAKQFADLVASSAEGSQEVPVKSPFSGK